MDDQDFEFNIDQDFQLGQSYAENNIEASSKQLYDWKIKHFQFIKAMNLVKIVINQLPTYQ
jgi:hypothetical protein